MKQLLSIFLIASCLLVTAQPKKAPQMAPVLESGYYINSKNDTVRGSVQTNPEDPTDFYTKFNFQPEKGGKKVMPIDSKKAKAYGYDGKHFVLIDFDDLKIFVERLTDGRLNFFEYRYNGKIDGNKAIVSDYFIQDNRAEGEDMKLREIKKISTKFYKKDLKPYMKDQPMIWSDFDKFNFNRDAVINAINEFNKYYIISSN